QQQRRQQKYVAAAASLERAIRISPRNAELYLELAKVRQEQGNQGQAEQLCKKAVALSNQATVIKFDCLALLLEN
ncbi:MAG: tetratricopeptide repeat protein, partial [Pseudomonadales bacterium]|nr:tetratricopeptide repeat protein [Pseudomonadales bacterium]